MKPYRVISFPLYLSGIEDQINLLESQGYEFICMVKGSDGGLFKRKKLEVNEAPRPVEVKLPVAAAPEPPKVPVVMHLPSRNPQQQKGYKR